MYCGVKVSAPCRTAPQPASRRGRLWARKLQDLSSRTTGEKCGESPCCDFTARTGTSDRRLVLIKGESDTFLHLQVVSLNNNQSLGHMDGALFVFWRENDTCDSVLSPGIYLNMDTAQIPVGYHCAWGFFSFSFLFFSRARLQNT